jgi:CRP-like cAMP-binding protein
VSESGYQARGHDVSRSVWGRLGERFGLVSMRPKLVDDARVRRIGDEVELAQASTGRTVPLSDSEVRIVRLFDGKRTIAELIAGEITNGGRIEIEPVLMLVDRVMRAEMLENFPPNLFGQLEHYIARQERPRSSAQGAALDDDVWDPETAAARMQIPVEGEELSAYEQVPWQPKTPLLAERAQFFRDVELFRTLDTHAVGVLAETAKEEAFPAAYNVITEGEIAERFYIVRSGEVNVTKRDENDVPKRIAKLGPGDWFGEAGILDRRMRNASVRVSPSRPVQVYSFDAEVFEKIISPRIDAFRGRQILARRREGLAQIPLFESLDDSDRERLAHAVREIHLPQKEVVFRQGDAGDRFYIIVEGAVGVIRDGVPIARLGEGEFFGETALLFTSDRTATVVATEDCTFWTLDRPAFERIVREHLLGRRDMMPTVLNRLHG